MDSRKNKIAEISILIIRGEKEIEVTLGIGAPENACCYAYIDGFEEPRRKIGVSNWDAFLRALSWLSVRLEELERRGYKFAIADCDPPLPVTALELMQGISYVRGVKA